MTRPYTSTLPQASTRRNWCRRALDGLVLGLAGSAAWSQTPGQTLLPPSRSLPDELKLALSRRQVLVVMVSLDGCPFCRTARQSHLVPMWREGQTMVQVDLRSSVMTRDFEGRSVSHDELTRRWKVGIAPTLMFFGPGGQEVADRMEGAYLPDFYGPYLEERLQQGRKRLGQAASTP